MQGQNPNTQNMLVIDPTSDPNEDYAPSNDMEGMFGQNIQAPYHAHNDSNLVPRDVIQEDENERTQDSALIRITEEKEETKQASSYHDLQSQSSPPKSTHLKVNDNNSDDDDRYDDDDDEDEVDEVDEVDEEPISTKPFENKIVQDGPINQDEYLKMINNPVERPTTRNPRMQRKGDNSKDSEPSNRHNEGSLGDVDQKESSPHTKKLETEIKGGFEFPDDSD
jgi:hypothetical protein